MCLCVLGLWVPYSRPCPCVPVQGQRWHPHGLALLRTTGLPLWAPTVLGRDALWVQGKPCQANVAASCLRAEMGLALLLPGLSLPGKPLPGSVPSLPGETPGSPQPVPVLGAREMWG